MQKIAIYGKGGVGKSTISSGLSAALARSGKKVLHVGCDPKQDSTIRLMHGQRIPTVIESLNRPGLPFIRKGAFGIDCIECGGPKPGVGCAGRGISAMFERFQRSAILEKDYDVALFDVLGDVVCGGFAAPLRRGFAEKVFIVVSDDAMSLYAANRIMHAIDTYKANGVGFGGFIENTLGKQKGLLARFADMSNIDVLHRFYHDDDIASAEMEYKTVVESYPESAASKSFAELSQKMLDSRKNHPKVMDDEEFNRVMRGLDGKVQ